MDAIILLLVFFAGYIVGVIRMAMKFAREIKEAAEAVGLDLDKAIKQVEEPEETQVHKLSVEKHGETLYLFDRNGDQFICQGSSVQELAQLAQKYKNIVLATAIYNNKVFMFQDGQSKEYTSNES